MSRADVLLNDGTIRLLQLACSSILWKVGSILSTTSLAVMHRTMPSKICGARALPYDAPYHLEVG